MRKALFRCVVFLAALRYLLGGQLPPPEKIKAAAVHISGTIEDILIYAGFEAK